MEKIAVKSELLLNVDEKSVLQPTCFSSSLRCCWQVSALFVRRRCDCLASSPPFTNIQT